MSTRDIIAWCPSFFAPSTSENHHFSYYHCTADADLATPTSTSFDSKVTWTASRTTNSRVRRLPCMPPNPSPVADTLHAYLPARPQLPPRPRTTPASASRGSRSPSRPPSLYPSPTHRACVLCCSQIRAQSRTASRTSPTMRTATRPRRRRTIMLTFLLTTTTSRCRGGGRQRARARAAASRCGDKRASSASLAGLRAGSPSSHKAVGTA